MNEYKRFTKKDKYGHWYTDTKINDRFMWSINGKIWERDLTNCAFDGEVIDRLAELEDKIENESLIEIDKNLIGQGIVGIHHFTSVRYELDLAEHIVIGFTIDGVVTYNMEDDYNDEFRNGMFFLYNEKGREEAEAKFKELTNGSIIAATTPATSMGNEVK